MKTRMRAMVLAAALFASPLTAAAATIDFEGLDDITPIASGYGDLNWTNMYSLDSGNYIGTGYSAGSTSGNNVAFNGWGSPASFSSLTDFSLVGMNLTAAWYDGLQVTILGFDDGIQTFSYLATLSQTAASHIVLNWAGIDAVSFTSSPNSQFAMDDLVIGADSPAPVPVPAAGALMIGALGALAALRRRRAAR